MACLLLPTLTNTVFADSPEFIPFSLSASDLTDLINGIDKTKANDSYIRSLYYRGRFLLLSATDKNMTLKSAVQSLKEILKNQPDSILLQGTWQEKSVYGVTTLEFTNNHFKQTFEDPYGYVTEGEIVEYDDVNHIFLVFVKSHSENWGQYQVDKFGRHSWQPYLDEPSLSKSGKVFNGIKYSGALNFFNSLDEALKDTDIANGAANAINGKFSVFQRQ